jgi:ABC-type arginine/histidine transport system permease subunit
MPVPEYEASAGKTGKTCPSTHAKGILSLFLTVLLCLPSLIGGMALLVNLLLYREIEQWGQTLSALIALGVIAGTPLLLLAAVVNGITALRGRVSAGIKCAQLLLASVAAIVELSLLFRFRM